MIDVAGGMVLRTIASLGPELGAFALSPDGDRVAILVGTHLRAFDVASGQQVANFALTTRRALSPETGLWLAGDGRHAITLDPDAMIGWDLTAAKEVSREPRDHTFPTTLLAVGAGWIFLEGATCTARQIATGAVQWRRDRCAGIAAGASAERLLVVRGPSALDVVDPRTGKSVLPSPRPEGPSGTVSALVVAVDGRVAGASWDHTNWIWDDTGGHELALPVEARYTVGFLTDGQLAVVGETRAGIEVFAFGSDRALRSSTDIPHEARLGGGVIVGDRLVVEEVREHDYVRTVVDLSGKTKPTQLPMWNADRRARDLRNESRYGATFNRDLSRAYIMGGGGPALHLWNTRTGRLLAEMPPSSHRLATGLGLSRDENHLLVTYRDGAVELRSAADLGLERTFASGPKFAAVGALSPDGTLVVAAAPDGLFVWRLADGAPLATVDFTANPEAPSAVAFTPDGKTLWVGTTLGNLHRFAVHD